MCGLKSCKSTLRYACPGSASSSESRGVGDAVDSFNLCARYFEAQRVPVLGGIFNKLAPAGFYSLDNCRRYVSSYMALRRPRQRVYGMLPAQESLASAGDVNGDGRDDILIGALYGDDVATQAGKTYLILSHL